MPKLQKRVHAGGGSAHARNGWYGRRGGDGEGGEGGIGGGNDLRQGAEWVGRTNGEVHKRFVLNMSVYT